MRGDSSGCCALVIAAVSFAAVCGAETRTWVGPAGGDWYAAENWSPEGTPDPHDWLEFLDDANVAIGNGLLVEGESAGVVVEHAALRAGPDSRINSGGFLDIRTGGHVQMDGSAYLGYNATVAVHGDGALWVIADELLVGNGNGEPSVDVGPGGTLFLGGGLMVWPYGTVNLCGGTVRTNRMDLRVTMLAFEGNDHPPGHFAFYSGTICFDCDVETRPGNAVFSFFGDVPTVQPAQTLRVLGTLSLWTPLVLDGGALSVERIENGELLDFRKGTLALTDSNATVGREGMFGHVVALDSGMTVDIARTATVSPTGLLRLDGGELRAGRFVNDGEVQLGGTASRLSGGTLENRGAIIGTGLIEGPLGNGANGQLRAGAGQRLKLIGGEATNAGIIEGLGGEVECAGGLVNDPGGLIAGTDARLRFGTGLNNRGAVALTSGYSHVFGDIANEPGGTVVVTGDGWAAFYGDVQNDGEIRVGGGSTAVWLGGVGGVGRFEGAGTNCFEGDLRPGHSIGTLAFAGDVAMRSLSSLHIELTGDAWNGAQPVCDALAVTGDVALAGRLALDWWPIPHDPNGRFGGTYDILIYAGELDGAFTGFGGTIGAAYVADIDYAVDGGDGLRAVRITLYDLLDGDCDLDGDVDADDLTIIKGGQHLTDAAWTDGDVSSDGAVDHLDYLVWKATVGTSVPGAVVPEPGAWALLALGGLALAVRRRPRRVRPRWTRMDVGNGRCCSGWLFSTACLPTCVMP